MELIDKSGVITEAEKIREQVIRLRYAVDANCIVTIRNACECLESSIDSFVNSIDTLEVKEVDLWTEFGNFIEHYRNRETGYTDFNVAEYFFELGLKAQKGE